MSLLNRYIFRQLRTYFAFILCVLVSIVWLTTALRQLELITVQGQTLWLYLGVTSLAIPMLVAQVAPFALFIAALFTLNKLNTDSEWIVMTAAGCSPERLRRPFAVLAVAVMALSAALTLYAVPACLGVLRQVITAAHADLVNTIIQPGKFTTVDGALTFHVRDRAANGALLGVFVNDGRAQEMDVTYIGSKGLITKTPDGTFLILDRGQIVRRPKGKEFGSIIAFDRYAFNLSALISADTNATFAPSERSTSALLNSEKLEGIDDKYRARARSELHDRFSIPLYVPAFAAIAFAALGQAATTRSARTQALVLAICAAALLRVCGFVALGLAQRHSLAVPLVYVVPLAGMAAALAWTSGNGLLMFLNSLFYRRRLPGKPRRQ